MAKKRPATPQKERNRNKEVDGDPQQRLRKRLLEAILKSEQLRKQRPR